VQVVLAHFCPLGQLVQVACFAFAFFTGVPTFAITEVAANAIASMLNIIFFIFCLFKKLNKIRFGVKVVQKLFNKLSAASSQLYGNQINYQFYKVELVSSIGMQNLKAA
jgi:hypothetical protein